MLKVWAITLVGIMCFTQAVAQQYGSEYDNPSSMQSSDLLISDSIINEIKQTPLPVQFGAVLSITNAQDSLRDALATLGSPNFGIGIVLFGGYNLDPIPVLIGAEAGVSFNGQSNRLYLQPGPGGRIDSMDYTSSNIHVPVNLILRFQPNIESFLFPYAEMVGGFRVYSSRLNIEHSNIYMHNSNSSHQADVSWTYGAGLGLMVKFLDVIDLPSTLQRTLVDIKMRYITGSSVNLHRYSINDDQSITTKSQLVRIPNLVEFALGITFQF